MARNYATTEQYAALAEEPFDGLDPKLVKRLRSATIEIDALTRLWVYDVDDDGMPTSVKTLEAFTEATCAVVEYWEASGDHTGAESKAGAISIGSVTLGTTSSRVNENPKPSDHIGEKAVRILHEEALRILSEGRLSTDPRY
jgi:hypothetical protein